MRARLTFVPLVLLSVLAAGQIVTRSTRAKLTVRVFSAETRLPLQERVNVILMNGAGDIEDDRMTDSEGRVTFTTENGNHRLRVPSGEYLEYNGTFEIEAGASTHTEYVYLKRKSVAGVAEASPGEGTISAQRLKIPSAAAKQYNRGVAAMKKKRYALAQQYFQRAVKIYPEYDLAYNSLGIIAVNEKDLPAAQAAFRAAIRINDHYAQAYRNLARLVLADQKFAEAEDLLAKSLTVEPINAWALTQLAYAQLQERKFAPALQSARQAHLLPHEGQAQAHMIAAAALEALQRPAEAVNEYSLYLQEDPSGQYARQARESVARLQAVLQE